MRQISAYEASDGCKFDSYDKCLDHELLIVAVKEAMLPLGPEKEIRSTEYRQHDREACLQAKRNMVAICLKEYGTAFGVFMNDADDIHPLSGAGRVISDCGPRPLERAWSRLSRINWENFREYEQPYYAMHPDEATAAIA